MLFLRVFALNDFKAPISHSNYVFLSRTFERINRPIDTGLVPGHVYYYSYIRTSTETLMENAKAITVMEIVLLAQTSFLLLHAINYCVRTRIDSASENSAFNSR